MLLVVDCREDVVPSPPDTAPRSTERALRHMGWPFPVNENYTAPLPPRRCGSMPAAQPQSARTPRRSPVPAPVALPVPRFALELA